jgi:hypothetical protein
LVSTKKTGPGGARVGAGRKPKPPSEKQNQPVVAKFTIGERRTLERVAAGAPLGTYVRELVLSHLARAAVRKPRGT